MPHAPADPLGDNLAEFVPYRTSGGFPSARFPISAAGTVIIPGTIRPGIYGVYFTEDVDQAETVMGKFAVVKTAAGTVFTDVLETPVISGPGAGAALFDVGGDAAAATEVNVSVTTPGICTIKTGSSIAAGHIVMWKEVNFDPAAPV